MRPFLALVLAATASAAVPPPSETPAHVLVSGRTSTLIDARVVAVGDEIPTTYSGDRVKNTPGFAWFVSQHWALKTDYDDAKARTYLELLELAYPHYVQLFGVEPPGIADTRMAIVYGSTKERLDLAMRSDGVVWDFGGGGITLEGYRGGYQYPSGTLQYHQRYILLHECAHLVQMCLAGTIRTPSWWHEGVADRISSHVWEEQRHRLTLSVVDKPTINNWYDGMSQRVLDGLSAREVTGSTLGRSENFLLCAFLDSDPQRAQRFRLFRDEIVFQDSDDATRAALFTELFGPWEQVQDELKRWCGAHRNRFHYVDWGWEQDASTLWSYGWPQRTSWSETDLLLPPGERPLDDALAWDWPRARTPPAIVGAVARGVAEPSVGCVVDFSRWKGNGRAGLGLGVIGDGAPGSPRVKLLIDAEQDLVVDAEGFGAGTQRIPIPPALRDAAAGDHQRYGINAHIARERLEVTLRAQASATVAPQELRASLPLSADQRHELMTSPVAVLSRDGRHGVEPWCDAGGEPDADVTKPAPPNRWRALVDQPLEHLFHAWWALRANAPRPLVGERDALTAAVSRAASEQRDALRDLIAMRDELDAAIATAAVTDDARAAARDRLARAITAAGDVLATP